MFAGRDRRIPAGQEDRGQRSQQVPIVDATRDSVGGGLKGNEANPEEVRNRETEGKRRRETKGDVKIVQTVRLFLTGGCFDDFIFLIPFEHALLLHAVLQRLFSVICSFDRQLKPDSLYCMETLSIYQSIYQSIFLLFILLFFMHLQRRYFNDTLQHRKVTVLTVSLLPPTVFLLLYSSLTATQLLQ